MTLYPGLEPGDIQESQPFLPTCKYGSFGPLWCILWQNWLLCLIRGASILPAPLVLARGSIMHHLFARSKSYLSSTLQLTRSLLVHKWPLTSQTKTDGSHCECVLMSWVKMLEGLGADLILTVGRMTAGHAIIVKSFSIVADFVNVVEFNMAAFTWCAGPL